MNKYILLLILKIISVTNKDTFKPIDFETTILSSVLLTLPSIPVTVQELRSFYFDNKAVSKETVSNCVDFLGDQYFHRGIMEVADIQVNRGNSCKPTYLYKFSYDSEESIIKKLMNIKIPGIVTNRYKVKIFIFKECKNYYYIGKILF